MRRIKVGDVEWDILEGRVIAVVPIRVDATGRGKASYEAAENLLLEHVTATCTEVGGLDIVRLGWTNNAGQNQDFYSAVRDANIVYPIAGTLFTKADVRPLDYWGLLFKRAVARTFEAVDAGGALPYDVELTLHLRRLREVGAPAVPAPSDARSGLQVPSGAQTRQFTGIPRTR